MYIGDYLGRREIYSPDKLAIVDYSKSPEWRLTYRQWNARVKRLANWLHDVADIQKGDRVAILARDGIEHLDCLYACGKLGAIHTALNWRLHWREIAGLVEKTQPKVLIYSDDFKPGVVELENAIRHTQYAIRPRLRLPHHRALPPQPGHPARPPRQGADDDPAAAADRGRSRGGVAAGLLRAGADADGTGRRGRVLPRAGHPRGPC